MDRAEVEGVCVVLEVLAKESIVGRVSDTHALSIFTTSIYTPDTERATSPSTRSINPKPFSSANHFTVPVTPALMSFSSFSESSTRVVSLSWVDMSFLKGIRFISTQPLDSLRLPCSTA